MASVERDYVNLEVLIYSSLDYLYHENYTERVLYKSLGITIVEEYINSSKYSFHVLLIFQESNQIKRFASEIYVS